jgi:hypothetical protein
MNNSIRKVCAVTAIFAFAALSMSCGAVNEITWQTEVVSPDGRWTATAMTEGTSGPGNNYLGTAVYLKRTGAKGRGYEILGYPEDNPSWQRGRAPLSLVWRGSQYLAIIFKQVPKLDLQVCKLSGIEISVERSP